MPMYSRMAANWPPLPHTLNGNDQETLTNTDNATLANATSDVHESVDLNGYGTFLSTGTNIPIILAPGVPFVDRFQVHRDLTCQHELLHVLQYTRDDGPGGRVKLNSQVWLEHRMVTNIVAIGHVFGMCLPHVLGLSVLIRL
jgi:hypothetical protein